MKILLLIFILTVNNGSSLAIHEMPDLRPFSTDGGLALCGKLAKTIEELIREEVWLRPDRVMVKCLKVPTS